MFKVPDRAGFELPVPSYHSQLITPLKIYVHAAVKYHKAVIDKYRSLNAGWTHNHVVCIKSTMLAAAGSQYPKAQMRV